MTFWTPETRTGELKCIAPYYDKDRTFTGIRGSHWISGSCMRDYGSFTLMPESGDLHLQPTDRAVHFDHSNEQMSPTTYQLNLPLQGIAMHVTGASHSGLMSFTWSKKELAWLVFQNNAWTTGGLTTLDLARNEITGHNPVHRLYAGAGESAGFAGYFVLQFDHPIARGGTWENKTQHSGPGNQPSRDGASQSTGAYVGFDIQPGETVHVRLGTSFVSIEEARRNLQAEVPTFDFGAVEQTASARWASILNTIDITASPEEREVFYTALFHAFLHPRAYSDVDGSYPRFAGGGQTMRADGFIYYDDFSVWDTFRAVHPLFTLLAPDRDVDMIRSLIAKGQQGGYLPIFPAWNSYTSEMVGDHAIAIIYDGYAKGLRGFDAETAFKLARKNAKQVPGESDSKDGRGRRALASYLKFGYIPLEDHVLDAFDPHQNEQVSRTMEYAFDDALLGRFAADLGHKEEAELFGRRGSNWKLVLDPVTGYARGRHEDGSWIAPFKANQEYTWLTEATASQQTFFVLHDIPGLIEAEGGYTAFVKKLDALFAEQAYDQGNEPSHHIAYLYDQGGQPWKAQEHLHQILTTDYKAQPDGLIGNDDSGQMSAWFIFSALGFYPVSPGDPRYWIGTPLYKDARIHLPNGKTFRVRKSASGPASPYIAKATLNGHPLQRPWLSHDELLHGGELHFTMSAQPSALWTQKTTR